MRTQGRCDSVTVATTAPRGSHPGSKQRRARRRTVRAGQRARRRSW